MRVALLISEFLMRCRRSIRCAFANQWRWMLSPATMTNSARSRSNGEAMS